MNDEKRTLVDGRPVPEDGSHTELKENGQQKDYVVLSQTERQKGFVRPVRTNYVHVGKKLRGDLERFEEPRTIDGKPYAGIDRFEIGDGKKAGTYLTQDQVDQVTRTGFYDGCGGLTTMSREIAETYARDPSFYGATFCYHCREHLPLNEFVWQGTNEQVGS